MVMYLREVWGVPDLRGSGLSLEENGSGLFRATFQRLVLLVERVW